MRVAWFSPLPPVRSGIAAYTSEVVPRFSSEFSVDCYSEAEAHDFVWRAKREPYELVVYQLGNAPCHDYMWAYLAAYPGLVVLHDARLHHARARLLLSKRRFDDYRAEFRFDHPDAPVGVEEYAVEGLGGPIYYLWPMLGVVMRTARMVAVHNEWVAADLRTQFPGVAIEVIPMGVPGTEVSASGTRARLGLSPGAVVFAVFGKITAEKRIAPILRVFGGLIPASPDACLLLVGDATGYPTLQDEINALGLTEHVRITGHVADEEIGSYLAIADVCLCLRWPTALETSASWLRCLAAGRPTVVTSLAHLTDVPTLDPRDWRCSSSTDAPVAVTIDLMDEDRALAMALQRLVGDVGLLDELARNGERYARSHHSMGAMVNAYERVLRLAAGREVPVPRANLPAHFVEDYSGHALAILRRFDLDALW